MERKLLDHTGRACAAWIAPALFVIASCSAEPNAAQPRVELVQVTEPTVACFAESNASSPRRGLGRCTLAPLAEEVVFRLASYTHSSYHRFRPDGTYETWDRQHMGVSRHDVGRWLEVSPGELVLTSSMRVRDVVYGVLHVYVGRPNNMSQIPPLQAKIAGYLAENPGDRSFSREDVENIQRLPAGGDATMSAIDVNGMPEEVSRADLEGLVAAMAAYRRASDQNVFRIALAAHRDMVFLVERDGRRDRSVEQVAARLATGREQDALYIFVAIAKSTADAELRTHQPFLYYPEMNGCVNCVAPPDAGSK